MISHDFSVSQWRCLNASKVWRGFSCPEVWHRIPASRSRSYWICMDICAYNEYIVIVFFDYVHVYAKDAWIILVCPSSIPCRPETPETRTVFCYGSCWWPFWRELVTRCPNQVTIDRNCDWKVILLILCFEYFWKLFQFLLLWSRCFHIFLWIPVWAVWGGFFCQPHMYLEVGHGGYGKLDATCDASRMLLKKKLTCPMKNSGWKTTFLLKWPLFRGHVSFRGWIKVYKLVIRRGWWLYLVTRYDLKLLFALPKLLLNRGPSERSKWTYKCAKKVYLKARRPMENL